MTDATPSSTPFRPGSVIIATLSNPREKFWGAILHLSPIGLSLRGVDLSSFDDFTAQIRDGEPFAAGVMFFPMHRVERLELDLPEGSLPSLAQRFAQKTGQDPAPILVSEFLPAAEDSVERTLLSAPPSVDEEETQPYDGSQISHGQEHRRHEAQGAPQPRGQERPGHTTENPPPGNPAGDKSR